MLSGIILLAHLTKKQKKIIRMWMGCARFIWNAKCKEDYYIFQYCIIKNIEGSSYEHRFS